MVLPHRKDQSTAPILNGKRSAFLAADDVEQIELTEPWKACRDAGAETHLIPVSRGEIQGFNHLDNGDTFKVDKTIDELRAEGDDRFVQPGGVAKPDFLRTKPKAVSFVRSFFEQGKPVGVNCHGPWMLIEAGVARGRTITSWPSLKTDLLNAGTKWVDEEVITNRGLTTSRKPDDLPAFCRKIVEEFAEGRHPAHAQAFQESAGMVTADRPVVLGRVRQSYGALNAPDSLMPGVLVLPNCWFDSVKMSVDWPSSGSGSYAISAVQSVRGPTRPMLIGPIQVSSPRPAPRPGTVQWQGLCVGVPRQSLLPDARRRPSSPPRYLVTLLRLILNVLGMAGGGKGYARYSGDRLLQPEMILIVLPISYLSGSR